MKKYYKILSFLIILISLIILFTVIKMLSNNTIENISNNNTEIEPIIQTSFYNNPIIPEGFYAVETDSASWSKIDGIPTGWNNGLVIEDSLGNQFVWVPVKNKQYNFSKSYSEFLKDTENQNEIQQIDKYGGFYISRYEAGIPDEISDSVSLYSEYTNDIIGIPLSQKNKVPWNFISLKNAKINATSMYNGPNIKSDLITTRQYLRILEWFYSTQFNMKKVQEHSNFSNATFKFSGLYSTDKGKTYKTGVDIEKNNNFLLSTGCTERNKINNIYDFFGNVAEFTDGYVKTRGYYSIGGYFDQPFVEDSFSAKLLGVSPLYRIGFRIVLYLE